MQSISPTIGLSGAFARARDLAIPARRRAKLDASLLRFSVGWPLCSSRIDQHWSMRDIDGAKHRAAAPAYCEIFANRVIVIDDTVTWPYPKHDC